MQPTTKAIFLVAALALLTVPVSVDAATATAAHSDLSEGGARVNCTNIPPALYGACLTLAWVCYTTDKCR